MEFAASGVLLWFRAGLDLDGLGSLAGDAVGIRHLKTALILCAGLQVQDAAGEAVGHGVIEVFTGAEDTFTADADQGEGFAPGTLSGCAELHGDGRVAVGVTVDGPFEAEIEKRGMFDDELSGCSRILGESGCGQSEGQGREAKESLHGSI